MEKTQIKIDGSEQEKGAILKILSKIPANLIFKMKKLNIKVLDIDRKFLGYIDNNNCIHIRKDLKIEELEYVILHEIGHFFDNESKNYFSNNLISSKNIFKDKNDQLSKKEYFADLFSVFIMNQKNDDYIILNKQPYSHVSKISENIWLSKNYYKDEINYIKGVI